MMVATFVALLLADYEVDDKNKVINKNKDDTL